MFEIFKSSGMLTGDKIEKEIKKGNIEIDPYNKQQLNPNSYNLTLHPELLVYKRNRTSIEDVINHPGENYSPKMSTEFNSNMPPIDMLKKNDTISFNISSGGIVLLPGILYIGRTVERTFTNKYIPMINGRSSIGRLGLSIHITAGFGDIGFNGTWTLEMTVVEPLVVYPYTEVAQVCFFTASGKQKELYKGKYQNQKDATPSKSYNDFD